MPCCSHDWEMCCMWTEHKHCRMFHIICMYSGTHLKGTQSEEALQTLSIGMGYKIHWQQLFTRFMVALFVINVWKFFLMWPWTQPICVWLSVFVTSWIRLAFVAQVFIMHTLTVFCSSLVIKVWVNIAAPGGLKFEPKKYIVAQIWIELSDLAYFSTLMLPFWAQHAVYISDVINKPIMCGKGIKYLTCQTFWERKQLLFIAKSEPMEPCPNELRFDWSNNKKVLLWINISR